MIPKEKSIVLNQAKQAYENLFGTLASKERQKRGQKYTMFPLGSFNSFFSSPSSPFSLDELTSAFLSALTGFKHLSENVVEVPSPWHAALLLFGLPVASFRFGETPFIFRGQNNSIWDLIPKIYRGGTDYKISHDALRIFSKVMFYSMPEQGVEFENALHGIGTDETSYEALAQHYGIPTTLLDFTTDPFVAIWFADHGNKESESASVFALRLNKANDLGLKIIFPPPIGARLFRQQGVFIKSDDSTQLRKECIEIRFRPTGKFALYNPDGTVLSSPVTGEDEDIWLERGAEKAREWAKNGIFKSPFMDTDLHRMLNHFYLDFGIEPIRKLRTTDALNILIKWTGNYFSIFGSIGQYVYRGRLTFDKNVIKLIARTNQNWTRAAVYVLNYIAPIAFEELNFEAIWTETSKELAALFNLELPDHFKWPI